MRWLNQYRRLQQKPNDLSSIPRTHTNVKEESRLNYYSVLPPHTLIPLADAAVPSVLGHIEIVSFMAVCVLI